MARVPDLATRELALDPDLEERLLEDVADADGQLGDGENSPGAGG